MRLSMMVAGLPRPGRFVLSCGRERMRPAAPSRAALGSVTVVSGLQTEQLFSSRNSYLTRLV